MKWFVIACFIATFSLALIGPLEPDLCIRCGNEYKVAYSCHCCGVNLCESCAADTEYFMEEEFDRGYSYGAEDGYDEGYSYGYDDGYSFGFDEGAEAGYGDGYSDAEKEYLPAAKE